MAGIYLHIPYCKQACHYCDFHFSTSQKGRDEMIIAMGVELESRAKELENDEVETIYFGGGTPSILSKKEIQFLLSKIRSNYDLSRSLEITLEGNPDDLVEQKLHDLRKVGINRLSIGIQTFESQALAFMNRAHTSEEAENCLLVAKEAGFINISADLIFAVPPEESSYARFKEDLTCLIKHDIPHISLYGLTIEPKTVFGHRLSKNELNVVSEEENARQYELAIDLLTAHGYMHYEVSNFAKPDFTSKHNTAYWYGEKYLGIGPGAHSYNGEYRSFNISNNPIYVNKILNNGSPATVEKLSQKEKFNEYLMTRLRTRSGLDLMEISRVWQIDLLEKHRDQLLKLVKEGKAEIRDEVFSLTSKGFCIADEITLFLFSEE